MAAKKLTGTYWGIKGGEAVCGFGESCSIAQKPHAGVDVVAATGNDVLALADGVVYRSRNGGVQGYHQEVTIKYDVRHVSKFVDFLYVLYGHVLKNSIPAVGAKIKRGQRIAKVGTAADAMSTPRRPIPPHIHVQVWPDELSARMYVNHKAIAPKYIRAVLEPDVILEDGQPGVPETPGKIIPVGAVPSKIAEPPHSFIQAYGGNYQKGNRTARDVDLLLMHETHSGQSDQGKGDASWFADPRARTSAPVIVGVSGNIIKTMRYADIGYHAGNWNVNLRSVGIEVDGYVGKSDNPDVQLRAVARVVRFLCGYFEIPMQLAGRGRERRIYQAGLLAHYQVPGNDHTDPDYSLQKVLDMARGM